MYQTTLSTKGQVTLPKPIRDALDLKEGDRIAFVVVDGSILVQPLNGKVEALFGALSSYAIEGTTLEDYDAAVGEGISEHVEGRAGQNSRRQSA